MSTEASNSRAMPKRPKPFYYEDYDTKSDPEYLYEARVANAYFDALESCIAQREEEIATLRAVVNKYIGDHGLTAEEAIREVSDGYGNNRDANILNLLPGEAKKEGEA
jgi:hypothetical protein